MKTISFLLMVLSLAGCMTHTITAATSPEKDALILVTTEHWAGINLGQKIKKCDIKQDSVHCQSVPVAFDDD